MKKPRVYVYRACQTCRKALAWLKEEGIDFERVPIRETPPTLAELKRVLAVSDLGLKGLFNVSGGDYRELNLKEKLPTLKESEALALLASRGNLVKRPFLVTRRGGAAGFRPEEWRQWLKN